jgi:hypothetical protein
LLRGSGRGVVVVGCDDGFGDTVGAEVIVGALRRRGCPCLPFQ